MRAQRAQGKVAAARGAAAGTAAPARPARRASPPARMGARSRHRHPAREHRRRAPAPVPLAELGLCGPGSLGRSGSLGAGCTPAPRGTGGSPQTPRPEASSRSSRSAQERGFLPTPALLLKMPSALPGCSDDGKEQDPQGQPSRRATGTVTQAGCANHPVFRPGPQGADRKRSSPALHGHGFVPLKARGAQAAWGRTEWGSVPADGWDGGGSRGSARAKPSDRKHIFGAGQWKREASKELAQPESRRSRRHGAACIAFAAAELASLPKPRKHLGGGEGPSRWPTSRWRRLISRRNSAGGAAPQGRGLEAGNLLPYLFFAFCIGLRAGAAMGRALPSAPA